jgi:hypothetical protein
MATRTIANGGGNWNATGTWVEAAVPVAGDAVVATGTSGQLTVNVASACATLILTGYTNTMTFNAVLTVTSTVTFVAGMTIAGTSGELKCTGAATLTSGGKTLTCGLRLAGAGTRTLADAWVVNGTVTFDTGNPVCNGNSITAGGLWSENVTGTTTLTLTGGTWQGGGTYVLSTTLAGNVTVSGTVLIGAMTLTYSSGTITTTSSKLRINGNATLNTAGVTWNDIWITGGSTYTINSLLTATGTMTLNDSNATFAGSAGWTVGTLISLGLYGSRTLTLTQGNTYTVTAGIGFAGASSTITWTITSSHATNKVVMNLQAGATCAAAFINATRIDSSGGLPIYSLGGTFTSCINWFNTFRQGVADPTCQVGI